MSGWTNGPLVSAPTTSATLTGLSPGTSYDLRVVAVNAAGPGGVSNVITRTTLASFVPSPAGTTIPPAGTIIGDDGSVWAVVGGVIQLNGTPRTETNSVTLLLKYTNGVIYQQNSLGDWWYYDPTQSQPWIATTDPRAAPPPIGGPAPGPAFQALTGNFNDMGNGQRCSTGCTSNFTGIAPTGMNYVQIKPFVINGVWRGGASGNYFGPNSAAFVDRGTYLFAPEVSPIYSAAGCPPTSQNINHIAGIRIPIGWWTAGSGHAATKWGLYYEPGFDTDVGGQVYAVINDYNPPGGDTFHVTGNMAGRGVTRATSWGSILDFTGETSGGSVPDGLGWIAFVGYNFTMNQIIADW